MYVFVRINYIRYDIFITEVVIFLLEIIIKLKLFLYRKYSLRNYKYYK